MEKDSKNSFILYQSYKTHFDLLTDAEVGQLMRAVFAYEENRDIPDFDGMLKMAFSFIKSDLDLNRQRYLERCAKNRENAQKRWHKKNVNNANASERNQSDANHADSDSDSDSDSDNDSDITPLNPPKGKSGSKKPKKQYPAVKEQIDSFTINEELQEALYAFVDMRKKQKKPVTEYGFMKLLNRLAGLAPGDQERLEIVNLAVANCWQGFYLPDETKARGKPPNKSFSDEMAEILEERGAL